MKPRYILLVLAILLLVGTVSAVTYTSQYPPEYSITYVKATSYMESYEPYNAVRQGGSLTGDGVNYAWISEWDGVTSSRFHIDLGSAKQINRIYYENSHNTGGYTDTGAKDFTFWGSNDADSFNELTLGVDTGWTQLTTSQSTFDIHVDADVADPKYITVTNTNSYRYYAIKATTNWGHSDLTGMRKVELQSEDGGAPPATGTIIKYPSWDGYGYNTTQSQTWDAIFTTIDSNVDTTSQGMYLGGVVVQTATAPNTVTYPRHGYMIFNMTDIDPTIKVTNISLTYYVSAATPPLTQLGDTDIVFTGGMTYYNRANPLVSDNLRMFNEPSWGNITISSLTPGTINTVYLNDEARIRLVSGGRYAVLYSRLAWELDKSYDGEWTNDSTSVYTQLYIGSIENSNSTVREYLTIKYENSYDTDHYNYTDGEDTVYIYNKTGSFNFTPRPGVTSVKVLVQAGGGGGGAKGTNSGGGGGGGGQTLYNASYPVTPGAPVSLTVGSGGVGGVCAVSSGTRGGNSTFGDLDAHGGGGGVVNAIGGAAIERDGGNGAGGSGRYNTTAGISDNGLGYSGGAGGTASGYRSGGGGGSGEVGGYANSGSYAGWGGNGTMNNITGQHLYFGGGGGGGSYSGGGKGNASFYGGGGAGDYYSGNTATAGRDGLGGGGGGGDYANSCTGDIGGEDGGSGVVIIRFTEGGEPGGDPPVASFTKSHTLLRIPQSVTVTDTSTNTPASWEWSWGDGTANSTTQNPTHQYTKRGTFSIDLTATNEYGSSSASAQLIRVTGYDTHW